MSFRSLVLLFFGLLTVGIAASVMIGQQQLNSLNQSTPNNTNKSGQLSSDIVSEDVTLTVTNGPAKQWELNASQAIYDRKQTQAELTTVSGTFYGSDGEPVAIYHSPNGHYDDTTKAVTLMGGATMESLDKNNPTGLTAPEIEWSSRSDKVTARGGSILHMGENIQSRSEGAEFTLNFNNIRLIGSVETSLLNE
jgi:LPS export ABC transporter protein LptC